MVSEANAEAVRMLDAWPAWHGGALALVGPAGSGKTHLALAWADAVSAVRVRAGVRLDELDALHGRPVLLEKAERADPETLFHLINMAGAPGGGLLLTSRARPSAWPAPLPDLRSRLNALPVAEIGAPDDALLRGVLEKLFRERNIRPSDEVFAYLVRRMERSIPVARTMVEKLDEASGAEHRAVSRALARQVLEDAAERDDLFVDRLAQARSSGEKP